MSFSIFFNKRRSIYGARDTQVRILGEKPSTPTAVAGEPRRIGPPGKVCDARSPRDADVGVALAGEQVEEGEYR